MVDLKSLRNRPFLVVTTIQRPAPEANTKLKGWAKDPRNWQMFERISVEDRITTKALSEAQVIVDIMAGKCVKSRFDDKTEDQVAEHYLGKYMDECKRGLDVWLTRQAREHLGTTEDIRKAAAEMRAAAGATATDMAPAPQAGGVVGGEAKMRIIPAAKPAEGLTPVVTPVVTTGEVSAHISPPRE